MSNMLDATISIQGTRPLLWHGFTPDAIPLTKQERSGVAGNDPTEWHRTVFLTAQRQPYLPATYLFGALKEAAKFTKRGRGSIQSMLVSTLMVRDERVLVGNQPLPDPLTTDPTQAFYLDVRSVRNPVTKGRNVRYRVAAATGWTLTFAITWDKTVVSRSEMEAVVLDAGRLAGVGSGRQIGFGRFALESFVLADAP
ncbi:hypothetical protein K2Z83_22770 [Oscillochloris sp. ZM17-4]|uniref:hypothetical protein n=1 Tax=Oscillochloris sp. ZM17-4 TaxID=2866714 RepID=UPI001C72B84D|nr:hypothetical protein [Oscillochloris sp. ZM17-4]MBX0330482.1 hypothetical protein [Oscillochloris sp. ZM17-4]